MATTRAIGSAHTSRGREQLQRQPQASDEHVVVLAGQQQGIVEQGHGGDSVAAAWGLAPSRRGRVGVGAPGVLGGAVGCVPPSRPSPAGEGGTRDQSILSLSSLKSRVWKPEAVFGPYHFTKIFSARPTSRARAALSSTTALKAGLALLDADGQRLGAEVLLEHHVLGLLRAELGVAAQQRGLVVDVAQPTPLPCCSAWKACWLCVEGHDLGRGHGLADVGLWVPPRMVSTFLPPSCDTSAMPLFFFTMAFWPVTKVVSEKSICASRSLLCVRPAATEVDVALQAARGCARHGDLLERGLHADLLGDGVGEVDLVAHDLARLGRVDDGGGLVEVPSTRRPRARPSS